MRNKIPQKSDSMDEQRRHGFRFEAMDEREQVLSYIQAAHTTGICGVQDLVLPAFFREVFEER